MKPNLTTTTGSNSGERGDGELRFPRMPMTGGEAIQREAAENLTGKTAPSGGWQPSEEEIAQAIGQHLRLSYCPWDVARKPDIAGVADAARAVRSLLPPVPAEGWRDAYYGLQKQFMQETLRTSEYFQLVNEMMKRLHDRGCRQEPWTKECADCQWMQKAAELMKRPINAAAPQFKGNPHAASSPLFDNQKSPLPSAHKNPSSRIKGT